eukprot:g77037.t1
MAYHAYHIAPGRDGRPDRLHLFGIDGVQEFDLLSSFYAEGSHPGGEAIDLEEMRRVADAHREPLEADIHPVLAFMTARGWAPKRPLPRYQMPSLIQLARQTRRAVFHLNKCERETNFAIECKDEQDLLLQWQSFVQTNDPDILLSYSGHNFDEQYLSARGGRRFGYLSRIHGYKCTVSDRRPLRWRHVPGRIDLDLFAYVKQSQLKFRDYRLDTVARDILRAQGKTGLEIKEMFSLFEQGNMSAVVEYCLQDCQLVIDLYGALGVDAADNALAEITHVFRQDLHTRGVSFRVLSHFYAEAKARGMVMARAKDGDRLQGDEKYVGAFVMQPKVTGLIDHVLTLDFASLYPSIMIAYNICSSTIVEPRQPRNPAGRYLDLVLPSGRSACFRQDVPGLVPTIVKNLLDARKRTKRQMRMAASDVERTVLNARQMAEKVCANAAYGFFGLKSSIYGMVVVAEAITTLGQQTIKKAIEIAEISFPGLSVVYTDTDSLFCHFTPKPSSREKLFALGKKVAQAVNSQLPSPISLEVEKTIEPFLISSKKMYSGWAFGSPSEDSKSLLVKGMRSTRRDGAPYFDKLYSELLKMMLAREPTSLCMSLIKTSLDKIMEPASLLCYEDFVLTTTLGDTYKNAETSVAVIVSRQMEPPPLPGDRLRYIMQNTGSIKQTKKFRQVLAADKGNVNKLAAYVRSSKPSLVSLLSLVGGDCVQLIDSYIEKLAPRSAGFTKGIDSFFIKKVKK